MLQVRYCRKLAHSSLRSPARTPGSLVLRVVLRVVLGVALRVVLRVALRVVLCVPTGPDMSNSSIATGAVSVAPGKRNSQTQPNSVGRCLVSTLLKRGINIHIYIYI